MSTDRPPAAIDPELLELLRCPLTGSRLRPEGDFLVARWLGGDGPSPDSPPANGRTKVVILPLLFGRTEQARHPQGIEGVRCPSQGAFS